MRKVDGEKVEVGKMSVEGGLFRHARIVVRQRSQRRLSSACAVPSSQGCSVWWSPAAVTIAPNKPRRRPIESKLPARPRQATTSGLQAIGTGVITTGPGSPATGCNAAIAAPNGCPAIGSMCIMAGCGMRGIGAEGSSAFVLLFEMPKIIEREAIRFACI